jgi:hypothetical protein
VIDKLHGKPEALETSENLPEISDLYRAAEDALLHSSDDEYESRKRNREFRKAFDRLDPAVRHAYLLKVFSKGMGRKMKKQMESQPMSIEDRQGSVSRKKIRAIMPASSSSYAVMPHGMNNVRLPEQSESAGPSVLTKIQAQRRRRLHRDDTPPSSSGEGRGQQALGKQAPLVNYGAGVRQTRKGGGKTIRAMAPILEFNETADDPYLMRQQVS